MGSVAGRKATPARSSSSGRPTMALSRLEKILAALAATGTRWATRPRLPDPRAVPGADR